MDVKLTKEQHTALGFFLKHDYLVVEAPRRSGKTVLLQQIVKLHPEKKIGVLCLSYPAFQRHYKQFKNCFYVEHREYMEEKPDMLIGDEVFIEPALVILDKKTKTRLLTACAISKLYVTFRWKWKNMQFVDEKWLQEDRKNMTEAVWEIYFGQYD